MAYSNLDSFDLETIEGTNKKETEKAVLFESEETGEETWIPKSLLEDWPDEGESGEWLVARWFAEKEGLL